MSNVNSGSSTTCAGASWLTDADVEGIGTTRLCVIREVSSLDITFTVIKLYYTQKAYMGL